MLHKRTLILSTLVALLALASIASAQVVRGSKIIERLTGETKGGWVKIDKNTRTPQYERVYCITLDGYPSCDWGDVRTIHVTTISRR